MNASIPNVQMNSKIANMNSWTSLHSNPEIMTRMYFLNLCNEVSIIAFRNEFNSSNGSMCGYCNSCSWSHFSFVFLLQTHRLFIGDPNYLSFSRVCKTMRLNQVRESRSHSKIVNAYLQKLGVPMHVASSMFWVRTTIYWTIYGRLW